MRRAGGKLGDRAEELACRHLQARGYLIVERNWRSLYGELDIVARDGETLVIVEVKARSGTTFGGPEAALTRQKRERILTAARAYLASFPSDLALRFDVVAVSKDRIVLYQDAFRPEGECSLAF